MFGYAAESLLFVETIYPQMRKNIIEGKEFNFLIPYYSGPMTNGERIDTYYCSNRKPDPRLYKTLSLSEFIQAFGTYKSVMSEAFPDRIILQLVLLQKMTKPSATSPPRKFK